MVKEHKTRSKYQGPCMSRNRNVKAPEHGMFHGVEETGFYLEGRGGPAEQEVFCKGFISLNILGGIERSRHTTRLRTIPNTPRSHRLNPKLKAGKPDARNLKLHIPKPQQAKPRC